MQGGGRLSAKGSVMSEEVVRNEGWVGEGYPGKGSLAKSSFMGWGVA